MPTKFNPKTNPIRVSNPINIPIHKTLKTHF